MPTPQSSLTITELGEISFVDKGDNPPAKVAILKSAPSTPGATVPDQIDVQKKIDEAVAAEVAKRAALEERIAKMEEAEAFGKTEAFCKSAGLDVAKLAPHIRAIEKAAPEAAKVVKEELAALVKSRDAAVRLNGGQIAGVGGRPSVNERIEKAIAPLIASGMSRPVAIAKAMESDITLAVGE